MTIALGNSLYFYCYQRDIWRSFYLRTLQLISSQCLVALWKVHLEILLSVMRQILGEQAQGRHGSPADRQSKGC